ncbi:Uncharacterized protein dnm_031940 [Desulfonema magnum]|uniref:Uncharacterized protein n=1 Tax=Desulfonema magnum TaxID=45655 RepID=A0A975GMX2_9BACT|nr:Uncharacterized protein dnm_031940 [Desulfonema magnum]
MCEYFFKESAYRKVSGLCAGLRRNPAFFPGPSVLPPEKAGFFPRVNIEKLWLLDDQVFFCHSCFRRNDRLFVRIGSKKLDHRVVRYLWDNDFKKKDKIIELFPNK